MKLSSLAFIAGSVLAFGAMPALADEFDAEYAKASADCDNRNLPNQVIMEACDRAIKISDLRMTRLKVEVACANAAWLGVPCKGQTPNR